MKITPQTKYPNLAACFTTQLELASVLNCCERTVRRSMTGKRRWEEYDIKTIENYTGLSREYLFKEVPDGSN